MSFNYPDDVSPSMFDKYWSELGPDLDESDCDATPDDYEGQESL